MIEYYRQRPDGRYYWLYEDLYGQTRELNSWDVEKLDKKVKAKRKELMLEEDIPNMLFKDYKDAVADATDYFYQSQSVKYVDTVGKNLAGLRLIK
ncbi:integrase DNA-binding domain-containing protein [Eubacterium sp.]|uniref:integrase DNA-binding domain-containing protein n=1 Tax=Eubacterium sp. TaxID=142586 RepID=UPI002FC8DE5C